MKLSVPFIPQQTYARFLRDQRRCLASVYFPLNHRTPWDARVRPGSGGALPDPVPQLAGGLAPLKGVKKYLLVNTRFVLPETYTRPERLVSFLDTAARLHEQVPLNGIVFSDFYLLRALDNTGHPLVADLEAVPGVNCMMDTMDKVRACMDMVAETRFRPPSRLLLDRSLNRNLWALRTIRKAVDQAYPGMSIELLANEGCILNCPFKPAHDAHIALSNTGLVKEATCTVNRQAGCHAYFFAHPDHFLKSPFIRPEDLGKYAEMAHAVKLCGRTLGTAFLTRCITAYQTGTFTGNLLDLMDAAHFLAEHFHVDNSLLGADFFATLSSCTKACKTCRLCKVLFQRSARKKTLTLNAYKDIE